MSMLIRILPPLLLAPALAFGVTDAELREQALAKIRERHPTGTCEWWTSQGVRMPRVIEQLLENPERVLDRFRLLEGLGCFTDEESVKKVRETAERADSSVLRMTAVRAAARSSAPGTADWLRGFISHEDPRTRVAAAEALQITGDSRAAGWIEEQARNEKEAWVARKLKKSLAGSSQTPGGVPVIVLPPRSERLKGDINASPEAQARLEKRWSGKWNGFRLVRKEGDRAAAPQVVAVSLEIEFKERKPRVRFQFASDAPSKGASLRGEASEVKVEAGAMTAILRDPEIVRQMGPKVGKSGIPEALRLSGELRGAGDAPPALLMEVSGIGVKAEPLFWLLLR